MMNNTKKDNEAENGRIDDSSIIAGSNKDDDAQVDVSHLNETVPTNLVPSEPMKEIKSDDASQTMKKAELSTTYMVETKQSNESNALPPGPDKLPRKPPRRAGGTQDPRPGAFAAAGAAPTVGEEGHRPRSDKTATKIRAAALNAGGPEVLAIEEPELPASSANLSNLSQGPEVLPIEEFVETPLAARRGNAANDAVPDEENPIRDSFREESVPQDSLLHGRDSPQRHSGEHSGASDEDNLFTHAVLVPVEPRTEDYVTANCAPAEADAQTAIMIDDPKKKKIRLDFDDRRTQIFCFTLLITIVGLAVGLGLAIGIGLRGGKTKTDPPTADRPETSSPTLTSQPSLSPSVSSIPTITQLESEWIQFGQDLKGSQVSEESGDNVAISRSGNRIGIGSPEFQFLNFTQAGRVRIYDASGKNWSLTGELFGASASDAFGEYVTFSGDGNRIAVGAQGYDGNTGFVKVFELNSGSWEPLGQTLLGDQVGSNFGHALALSEDGNVLGVSANRYDLNGLPDNGLLRLFNYSNGSWAQIGKDIFGDDSDDNSGNRISLSNDGRVVAIGAHNHFGSKGDKNGHVRVFQYVGGVNNTWKQIGDIEGENRRDRFGWSVSLSGDGNVFAAGAKRHRSAGDDSGAAWVYRYNNATGDWDISGRWLGQTKGDEFGHDVSLSNDGNAVAISSSRRTRSFVKVYKFRSQTWTKIGDTLFGKSIADDFGDSISISANGTRLVVGSPKNDEAATDSGLVQVFELNIL